MTTISRDRIQFEAYGDQVCDGNEQMHRDACAAAWAAAATDYLERHGGGEASVRLGVDLTRFAVMGDRQIADAADAAGFDAAQAYVDGALRRNANRRRVRRHQCNFRCRPRFIGVFVMAVVRVHVDGLRHDANTEATL